MKKLFKNSTLQITLYLPITLGPTITSQFFCDSHKKNLLRNKQIKTHAYTHKNMIPDGAGVGSNVGWGVGSGVGGATNAKQNTFFLIFL